MVRVQAVAVKQGQRKEAQEGLKIMGTVTCDCCGESFLIGHDSASANPAVAPRQAAWLEKVLADDHERKRRHQDKIDLPLW